MADHRSSDAGLLETLAAEDETLRAGNRKSSGTNSSEWLVNIADDVVVPMITTEVVEALRAGRLTNRSLVWRIGMHDWSALADVPQLRLAAGPSALPPAASTPGPVIHKSLVPPEQRRRSTLPFGLPVTLPKDDSGALAVYDRAPAELTFADSVRAEWQGSGRIVRQPTPPVPPSAPTPASAPPSATRPRLTPVPPVPSRLPQRALRPVPSNTFAPTTAEATLAAPSRSPNQWGDLSVVLASELRAEKKATKRLMLWAAVGSAVAASVFTFWVSRSVAPATSAAPVAAAPQAVAALQAEPVNIAPTPPPVLSAAPALAASAAPLPTVKPAVVAVIAKPRAVARPKPKVIVAPVSDSEVPANTVPTDDNSADKPSIAAALPIAAPTAATVVSPSLAPAMPAAHSEAPSSAPAAPTATSGS